jgi:hypothetical protein
MPSESLEEIRLLSNLESKAEKLLQIALFAQPELDERLAANDMRQLRERITQHFNLVPLKGSEVGNYIDFRLRAAGYHGPNPFSPRALELIAGISEGLSRRINILADKALLAAYSEGAHDVDVAQVRTAANDARFTRLLAKPARDWPWRGVATAAAAILLIAAALFFLNRPATPPTTTSEAATGAPAATPAPAPESATGSSPARPDRADKGK